MLSPSVPLKAIFIFISFESEQILIIGIKKRNVTIERQNIYIYKYQETHSHFHQRHLSYPTISPKLHGQEALAIHYHEVSKLVKEEDKENNG